MNRARGVLIVVGGLPGAGKSTVARAYVASTGAAYLRIDTIEQTLISGGDLRQPLGPVGYELGYALAAEQLRAGTRQVLAECVNPLAVTRDAWRQAGTTGGAAVVEVEVVCSDPVEHRRRVESRSTDIPGLRLPTWRDVRDREYHPWDRTRLTLDTARNSAEQCASVLRGQVDRVVDRATD